MTNTGIRLVSLFGRAGAGKTTVGDRLVKTHGFRHLALGRMLKDPALLVQIGIDPEAMAHAVATGRTIDVDALYTWLDATIASSDMPIVVDGYPRVPSAVDRFNALAERLGCGCVTVLHLDCPPGITAGRVSARAREDDQRVSIARRNDEFEKVQKPLLDRLARTISIVRIDASCGEEIVLDQVRTALALQEP